MIKQKNSRKFFANFIKGSLTVLLSVFIIYGVVQAGNLVPPSGTPQATLHTLSDIYNRLTTGDTSAEGSHSFTFSDSLSGSGHTLTDIYNAIPTHQSLSSSSVSVNAGIYADTTLPTIDPDLIATNIKKSVNIFGIDGLLLPDGGDSTPAHVLIGKKFYGGSQVDWNLNTGTMPDNSGLADFAPTSTDVAIPTGFYDGITKIKGDADLIPANIKKGFNIFDVDGSLLPEGGSATASHVLATKTFFGDSQIDWNLQLGTMPDHTGLTNFDPSVGNVSIPTGFYDGTTAINGDADLIASNIKSGVNIFGVDGSLDTTPTYGDDDPSKVLNTATNPGTYDAVTGSTYNTLNLSVGTVKSGTAFGESLVGEYPSASYPLSGGTGADALASHIMSGFEAWSKAGTLITGTLPTHTLSSSSDALLAGYYDATTLPTVDTDLMTDNIKAGVNIFGITGKSSVVDTFDADAIAGDILTGKTGYVNGSKITGTLLSKVGSATVFTPGTTDQLITQGYYGGALGDGKVLGDTDLIASNIKSGVNIFGVTGSFGLDTSDATAIAGNILSTKTAYVNGVKLTGTMVDKTGSATILTPSTSDQLITQGYYGGALGDGKVLGDTDLLATNIGADVNIFGVTGTLLKNLYSGSATSGDYPQSTGGVDDYNNGGATPADSYKGTWTTCNAGNSYCGTGDATNADKKDNSTNLVWSKWIGGGATQTWFWANNAKYPNGLGDGVCDTNGEAACKVVKLTVPEGQTGCDALGGGWRLPYQKELMLAYVDGSWANLSNAGYSYWSATTVSNNTQSAWLTSLTNGTTYYNSKTNSASYRVRCVR